MKLEREGIVGTGSERQAKMEILGQWFGSVGRAVASDTGGLRFESSHRQKLY